MPSPTESGRTDTEAFLRGYATNLEAEIEHLHKALALAVEAFLGWASPGDEKDERVINEAIEGFIQDANLRLLLKRGEERRDA